MQLINHLGPNNSTGFARYSYEFVITVIVITEFDYMFFEQKIFACVTVKRPNQFSNTIYAYVSCILFTRLLK